MQFKVHNPNNLPTIPIADLLPSQGDLKDLTEKNYNKLKNVILRRGFSVPVYIWEDDKGIKHLGDTNLYSTVGSRVKHIAGIQNRNQEHPTMKPINILSYLINNSSKAGDLVFDSFLGSGSTLIASEQMGRVCYGAELDPQYVDVIRKRYAKFISPDNEIPENWEELTPKIRE